jgi:heme-degrading monooxygenase HmoA
LRGFLSGSILRRNVPLGVEFLVVTNWESLEAIRAFAGNDVETAVVPQAVRGLMVEFDTHARHYEVVV